MGSINDLYVDRVQQSWSVPAEANNALATATKAAVANTRHVLVKVRASFSGSATALLTIKSGTAVLDKFVIYDKDEISYGEMGLQANADNQAVSAELGASGAVNVIGYVTIFGYTTYMPA